MKHLHREPLLHFLLLGAILFAVHAWRARQRPSRQAETPQIQVTAAVIERLRAGYEWQFSHTPDFDELRGLVAAHIREEVLYREALAMGLDRDDTIVRRRMAQKMEFLTDDLVASAAPEETALQMYFAENAARYAKPSRVSFRHVYFSEEKHGTSAHAAAADALAALQKGADDQVLGDSFLHGFEFSDQEPADITALFGAAFAGQLAGLHEGEWSGPVASSYGTHLVLIQKRGDPRPVHLAEVRERVLRDLDEDRRRTANREVFDKLRARYQVAVDEPALAKAATPRTAYR